MADIPTTTYTDQVDSDHTRAKFPSYRPLQKSILHARFTHTFDGAPTTGDKLQLGKLGIPGAIILPEHCRISSLAGGISAVVSLEKRDADDVETAVSGSATVAGDSVAPARIADNSTVEVAGDEYLQLSLDTVTDVADGDEIEVDIAYASVRRE